MNRPSITISLNPLLEAYCRFTFSTPVAEKEIKLRRPHDIFKLIHSNIISSDLPVKRPFMEHPVTFILPLDNINQYAIRYHFLHVSPWGVQKITDGIEYEFRRWIRERFDSGYAKRYEQKCIIEAILRGLNLRDNSTNFDAIKKIDYRHRRKIEEKRFAELLTISMSQD